MKSRYRFRLSQRNRFRLNKKGRFRLPRRFKRIRLEWKPRWQPEISGWAGNYIMQNKWRTDPILTYQDLMQEAYIVYMRVVESYPRVTEPKHFMALYKTSLRNEIYNLSREAYKMQMIERDLSNDIALKHEVMDLSSGDSKLAALIATAPPEIRQLLEALSDDSKLEELRSPYRVHKGMPRESFNARLRRICGIQEPVDLVGNLRSWLTT